MIRISLSECLEDNPSCPMWIEIGVLFIRVTYVSFLDKSKGGTPAQVSLCRNNRLRGLLLKLSQSPQRHHGAAERSILNFPIEQLWGWELLLKVSKVVLRTPDRGLPLPKGICFGLPGDVPLTLLKFKFEKESSSQQVKRHCNPRVLPGMC